MFLNGGLPIDTSSTKVEKVSYSEQHSIPDWRGNVAARKQIKKKQYKGVMFTPLPDTSMFAMRLRNPVDSFELHSGVGNGLLPLRKTNIASQTSSKLAQTIPESITISTAKNVETIAPKTNIFKSVVKFFTKLFKKAPKI